MLRARRFRPVELELLIVPALLGVGGLLLVVLLERGTLVFDWEDIYVGGAFVAALLVVHLVLSFTRSGVDQMLFPIVAVLTGLGMIMIQRLDALETDRNLQGSAVRQTIWIFLGIAAMLLTIRFFPLLDRLRRYKYTLAVFGVLLLLGLLSPLGTIRGGARLWYDLRVTLFQPGEIVKIVIVIFLAAYLDERRDLLASEYRLGRIRLPPLPYLAPMFAMWGVSLLTFILLRDLGSALLFFGIFLAMLYSLTGRALYVWVLGACFLGGAALAYQLFGHVRIRVNSWLYPLSDPGDTTYQISQSLFALGSGGLYGSGLGYGSPAMMPATHTDFVFSALAEELGLIGSLAILGLYLLLIYRGFYIALRARSGFHQMVAIGLTTIFGLQTFIIIAGNIKLIPLTGITLPFVAYGGSSILVNFVMIGILLALSAERPEARA